MQNWGGTQPSVKLQFPLLAARHTHEEFKEIPILDKMGGLSLFGSNWQVMEYIRDKEPEKLAAYIAWGGLKASRGYGVKIVNPRRRRSLGGLGGKKRKRTL